MSTDGGRIHVVREADGLATLPARAVIGGQTHPIADWFADGMVVEAGGADWVVGQRVSAHLVLPFSATSLSTELVCEVAHLTAGRVGLRFLGVGAEQVDLLRQVAEAHRSGRVPSANGFLAEAPPRVATGTDRGTADPGPLPWRKALPPTLHRLLRYGVLLVLGAAFLALASAVVYKYFFTVDTVIAAVVATSFDIRAPLDGRVGGSALRPGRRLQTGDFIFTVRSDSLEHDLTAAGAELEKEDARLVALHQTLRERQAFFAEYLRSAAAEHRKVEAETQRAKVALDLAEQRHARLRELHARQLVSTQDLEDGIQATALAQMEYRRARAALLQADSNTRMARQGHYYSGSRLEGGEPREIEREIKLAEASVGIARARVQALSAQIEGSTVRAPCDCVVHAVGAQPGEWVTKGHLVYRLHHTDVPGLLLEALVLQEVASAISIGATADILLADRDQVLSGRVVEINRTGPREKRTGLPVPPAESERYAAVLIALPKEVPDAAVGLPARVTFRLRRPLPLLGS